MGEDFPAAGFAGDRARIDGDDDALAPEAMRALVDELRVLDGRRVDAHLIGTELEHRLHVARGADTSADGERDEHLVRGSGDHLIGGAPVIRRSRDVEEDQFVSALRFVEARQLDRVAGIAQGDERDALDDAAAIDVEAGDDAAGEHVTIVERAVENVEPETVLPGGYRAATAASASGSVKVRS